MTTRIGTRDKLKYNSTTLSLLDGDKARIERLRKKMDMPMNKVVSTALSVLEELITAQEKGKKVKIDEENIRFMVVPFVVPPPSSAP